MKISEKRLFNIISESIERNLKESFDYMGGFSQFEADDDNEPNKLEKSEDGKADFNKEDEKKQQRRAQIEAFFKKDGVDVAPYAYKLYGIAPADNEDTNEMKNARSKFMKCLNHEPNEQGYPYSFTSAEINRLQSLTSNNQLNEGAETRGSIAGAALGAYYGGIKGMTTGYKIGKEVGKVVDNIKDDIKKDRNNEIKTNENMKKNVVKITESQLLSIIAECTAKCLKEIGDTPRGQYKMGKLAARKFDKGENPFSDAYAISVKANKQRENAIDNGKEQRAKKMKNAFEKGISKSERLKN